MTRTWILALAVCSLACSAGAVQAQYNDFAGESVPMEMVEIELTDKDGKPIKKKVVQRVKSDAYGNAGGSTFDLAVDGAFEGQKVAVLHLYPFGFEKTEAALAEKGLVVERWTTIPSVKELKKGLDGAAQFWLITSGAQSQLTDEHVKIIKDFFESGRGVYLWGDNDPYYTDTNVVAQALFGGQMLGNVPGDQTVTLSYEVGLSGLMADHLITTGMEYVYEGVTIATIQPNPALQPLIYGSAGNLVAAYYDAEGKRAILDGGFTRLYYKWDTAGTARYVKNAATWLMNVERFGEEILSEELREKKRALRKKYGITASSNTPKRKQRRWGE